jgi:hypothetical protein
VGCFFLSPSATYEQQDTHSLPVGRARRCDVRQQSVYDNTDGSMAHITIDITALTGTLTVTVEGIDPESGKTYTILASAALAGTGTTVLRIFPGATVAANLTANDIMPKFFRIKAVVVTGPVTFSVGVSLSN